MITLAKIHEQLLKHKPELNLNSRSRTKIVDKVLFVQIANRIGFNQEDIAKYLNKSKETVYVYLHDFIVYTSEWNLINKVIENLLADDPITPQKRYD